MNLESSLQQCNASGMQLKRVSGAAYLCITNMLFSRLLIAISNVLISAFLIISIRIGGHLLIAVYLNFTSTDY